MEIHFQFQLILRDGAVHKAQVLGDDLIKDETPHRRFDQALLHGAVCHGLLHSGFYPAVEGHDFILIG